MHSIQNETLQEEQFSTLKAVYDGLEMEEEEESLEAWLCRVKFFYPAGSGGLVFTADRDDPGLWWAQLYAPGALPKLSSMKKLMLLAAALGCKTIAVHVESEIVRRVLEILGLEQIEPDIYAINCK